MNSFKSNNLSLKFLKFTSSICKDRGTRKFEVVEKAQLLDLSLPGQNRRSTVGSSNFKITTVS